MAKEILVTNIPGRKEHLNLTLNVTGYCNLNCKYCYIKKENKDMSWKVARRAVDFAPSLGYKSITISFTTAEPLTRWSLVKRIIRYAETRGVKRFDIGTNGVLLTKSILKFFQKHNVIPMISIDGTKKSHDINRIYKNGKGSFDILDKKLNLIRKYFHRHLEIRITVTPKTVPYLSEAINYLKIKNLVDDTRINISPVVVGYKWREKDLSLLKNQLFIISSIFIKSYREGRPINICASECYPMNFTLLNLLKKKNTTAQSCCGGGTNLNVSPDGKIYPCYFVSSLKYRKKEKLCCGDIWKGITSPAIIRKFQGINPDLSCFTWNYIVNDDPRKPVDVYRKIYKLWLSASQYVNNALKK